MKNNVIRNTSPHVLLLCVCTVFNLHGCTQHYIDSTQQDWLVSFNEESAPGEVGDGPFTGQIITRLAGWLRAPQIGELSGMAVSQRDSSLYWAINDSGNAPVLYAMRQTGESLGAIKLPFANRDWEALASFEDAGKSWLLIADTGDNLRRRTSHTLYFIEEPDAATGQLAKLHSKIEFTYEDGPQNVESVAVSVQERAIYLVSKDATNPQLYALPLDLASTSTVANTEYPQLARLVGKMNPLPFTENDRYIEQLLAGRFLLGPTAMDINAEDNLAVVANYRHAYLYSRAPQQSWPQALMQDPLVITSHRLSQSESIAFGLNSSTVLVGSEGVHAPLLLVNAATH